MPRIDVRLVDCPNTPGVTENFNRILALLDAATGDVAVLEQDVEALKGVSTCTVTFDSDGGTEVASQTIAFGSVATEPDPPTLEGYTFEGWLDGETAFSFETAVTANITLTASWAEVVVEG